MLMVDLILNMDDVMVQTEFKINNDNIFVADDSFVEAGLIENAAQTCSAIVARDYFVDENNQNRKDVNVIGFISALKTLKIHALPNSNTSIITTARLVSKFVTDDYSLCTMNCTTYQETQLLLEGEINLFIQAKHTAVQIKTT